MRPMILFILLLVGATAQAEEGMWTLNNFPSDSVAKAYGFRPDTGWLDHVRLSAIRLAAGCSASFVSPTGLVQTNHHCARRCIDDISSASHNVTATGFYAKTEDDEVKCPSVEVNQLIAIDDVTARIQRATAGKNGAAFADALKAERATIAKECSKGDEHLRCDVVELYHGGVYDLYTYRRYQDVRLVFVPEQAIAFFGGDPDNFEFPRYDLDVSFLRVYQDGHPLDTRATYFPYAAKPAADGDLVFTAGHPGATSRLDTVAELTYQRDVALPRTLMYLSEMRGLLTQFSAESAEHERIANDQLFSVENTLKARKGQFQALVESTIIPARRDAEKRLRAKVAATPALNSPYGQAWSGIEAAIEAFRPKRDRYVYTEGGLGFRSQLFTLAKNLVRHAAEEGKPDQQRLPEFTEASFPALRQNLLSGAPIYPDLEKATLTFSLTKLREALGPDDPFVHKVLGLKSPAQLADELVDGTKLADVGVRKTLLTGGPDAIAGSDDPMIAFARLVDPDLRAARADYENTYDAPLKKYSAQIAKVIFAVEGTKAAPDATFTLRVSFGTIKGYREGATWINPITTLQGAFDRATGAPPFDLPASWIEAKTSLDLATPFDIASTNDIIGGNSGSPVINRAGEVVGLIFDGNIESLGGDFGYDITDNRAVSVSTAAIHEALDKIYHADRIVAELSPAGGGR